MRKIFSDDSSFHFLGKPGSQANPGIGNAITNTKSDQSIHLDSHGKGQSLDNMRTANKGGMSNDCWVAGTISGTAPKGKWERLSSEHGKWLEIRAGCICWFKASDGKA